MRFALIVILASASSARADPAPPALDDAVKSAAAAKQPLVIEFGASWCGPCKQFEADVLPQFSVQNALKGVTFVRYDVDVSPGLEAAAKFAIEAYPTFLVVDKHGNEAARRRGGLDANAFIELVTSAGSLAVDETDVRAALRAHPNDPAEHLRAARWFAKQRMTAEAIAHYTAVIKAHNVAQTDRDEATRACDHLKRVDLWHHDLVADKVAAARAAPLTIGVDDVTIAAVDSVLAPKEVKALMATVLAAQTDVARANALIYVALAAGANDEALATAKRLLAGSNQAMFLDTLAECFHVTGDRDQALATEDEATKVNGGGVMAEMLKRNRARFDTGKGDANEVVQLHARVAELWQRLEAADQLAPARAVANPSQTASRQQMMVDWRKAFNEEQALAKSLAQSCAAVVGNAKLAIAMIDVDAAGHITTNEVLADAATTTKLRACLQAGLAKATLTPFPAHNKREIRIDLKP